MKENILVVDDNQSILQIVSVKMGKAGYAVTTAESGAEALKLITNGSAGIDIILLDQMMPEMDGMETFGKIKEHSPNLPVIMLTGHGSLNLAIAFMKEGGADFIEKPVDFSILEVKIKQALEKSDLQKEMAVLKAERATLSGTLEIIGDLTHKINNPLNTLFTHVGLMIEKKECVGNAEKLQGAMDKIHLVLVELEKTLEEKKEKIEKGLKSIQK